MAFFLLYYSISLNFMKAWLFGFFVMFTSGVFAQFRNNTPFSFIDWQMQAVEAPTPDSLARFISSSYTNDLEKVRAAYSWITAHITYNTGIYKHRPASFKYPVDPLDTAAVWPSGDEMTARKVMFRRTAVCDGYAKLFKTLCEYLGVEARVVHGYGRTNVGDRKFRTNHTWNAVRIDSSWHLLDVTWAAGHINFNDDFVAQQNDFYFLTPPDQFINDHYPEDLNWTLMSEPPTLSEFKKMPFRSKNFIKYDIAAYFPVTGAIDATVGDTLSFSLQLKNAERVKSISPDPFADSVTISQWPFSTFIRPTVQKGNTVIYQYIAEAGKEWVHLVYNDDVVIRYRLNLLLPQTETVAGK